MQPGSNEKISQKLSEKAAEADKSSLNWSLLPTLGFFGILSVDIIDREKHPNARTYITIGSFAAAIAGAVMSWVKSARAKAFTEAKHTIEDNSAAPAITDNLSADPQWQAKLAAEQTPESARAK